MCPLNTVSCTPISAFQGTEYARGGPWPRLQSPILNNQSKPTPPEIITYQHADLHCHLPPDDHDFWFTVEMPRWLRGRSYAIPCPFTNGDISAIKPLPLGSCYFSGTDLEKNCPFIPSGGKCFRPSPRFSVFSTSVPWHLWLSQAKLRH